MLYPPFQVCLFYSYSALSNSNHAIYICISACLVDLHALSTRSLAQILAYCLYKPLKPRKHPRYKPYRDVTIIVPTIDSGDEIKLALASWLRNDPYEVIFVTIESAKPALEELARAVDPKGKFRIRVIVIKKPNKRNQMVWGANHVRTAITVFCDDDALWPDTMLTYMLAPFEGECCGEL